MPRGPFARSLCAGDCTLHHERNCDLWPPLPHRILTGRRTRMPRSATASPRRPTGTSSRCRTRRMVPSTAWASAGPKVVWTSTGAPALAAPARAGTEPVQLARGGAAGLSRRQGRRHRESGAPDRLPGGAAATPSRCANTSNAESASHDLVLQVLATLTFMPPAKTQAEAQAEAAIANPASENCVAQGGTLTIEETRRRRPVRHLLLRRQHAVRRMGAAAR